jgi:hypothetical protein
MDDAIENKPPWRRVIGIAFDLISICVLILLTRHRQNVAGIWVFASGLLLLIPQRWLVSSTRVRDGLFGAGAALTVAGLILVILNR